MMSAFTSPALASVSARRFPFLSVLYFSHGVIVKEPGCANTCYSACNVASP
jgi:hypothetical protein